METPFGPFEPSVELNDYETSCIRKALIFFEHVMNMVGGFSIDVSEGQPLIVKTINGKRLELPILEAAELDAQQMHDGLPTLLVPFRIDGRQQNVVTLFEFGMMIDMLTSVVLVSQTVNDGGQWWSGFKDLFK
jgi:hypothetical protein